jgi:hypothetical protein
MTELPPDWFACKREMRKLYDRYPEAFEDLMRHLISAGDDWPDRLPPMEGKGDKPVQVDRWSMACLLICYRLRPRTREQFLNWAADVGWGYGGQYFSGQWRNAATIEDHLKRAEALEKTDATFRAEVERLSPMLKDLIDTNPMPGWLTPEQSP